MIALHCGGKCMAVLFAAVIFASCGNETEARRTLRAVGAETFRAEVLRVCRVGFASGTSQRIADDELPESARPFRPLGLWAEPDGAYLLIDSDADGERGIYLPRILSEKDPLCSPVLTHEKLAEGVYWYEKKRI
jgi:hypothetical protein